MKRKIFAIILIISLGINAGVFASFAYHRMREKRYCEQGPSWRHSYIRRHLNLNKKQVGEIETACENMLQKTQPAREQIKIKREELALLLDGDADKQKVKALIRELSELQAELELHIFENAKLISQILTPEQRKIFHDLYENRLCGARMMGMKTAK